MHAMLVTLLYDKEFRITHMEMIKGIKGLGYHDELVVPIIENTAHEADLKESMDQAIKAYPKATAVLVRRHGVYIWGYISPRLVALSVRYFLAKTIPPLAETPGSTPRPRLSATTTWYADAFLFLAQPNRVLTASTALALQFEAAVRMKQLGLDPAAKPATSAQ
jgi:hypothetical protein